VILSRKGAKSRTRITRLHSKRTKARTHVARRTANADLKKKLADAREQLADLVEQQTATSEALTVTSEVLQAILSSHGDVEPIFQHMLTNAMRICEAKFGILYEFAKASFEQFPGWVCRPRILSTSGSGERGDRRTASVKPCLQSNLSTFPMWSRAALMLKETQGGWPQLISVEYELL
jgi:hypothetical protein